MLTRTVSGKIFHSKVQEQHVSESPTDILMFSLMELVYMTPLAFLCPGLWSLNDAFVYPSYFFRSFISFMAL